MTDLSLDDQCFFLAVQYWHATVIPKDAFAIVNLLQFYCLSCYWTFTLNILNELLLDLLELLNLIIDNLLEFEIVVWLKLCFCPDQISNEPNHLFSSARIVAVMYTNERFGSAHCFTKLANSYLSQTRSI